MGLNIMLNILFVKFTNMQLAGLALATSTAALVTVTMLFISLRIKIGPFGGKTILSVFIKAITSALLMAVITIIAYRKVSYFLGSGTIKEVITLAVAIGVGAIVYALSIVVLKVDEVNLILNGLKSKIKRS